MTRLQSLRAGGADSLPVPHGQPYRLEITARGQLDNVILRPAARQQPGPGQVEIRVRATGLNFRDVLNVLDLYPGDPGPLGGECAGEITGRRPGRGAVQAGRRGGGAGPGQLRHLRPDAGGVRRASSPHTSASRKRPPSPSVSCTAELALRRLGQLAAGRAVLIHAASGGVGMAAVQIARQVGAENIRYCRQPPQTRISQVAGHREQFIDSRSLAFAQQIMEATHGEGIDLVVNSLTGETIAASLSVLRTGGRFLELGKTDLWDQERVDQFKPGVNPASRRGQTRGCLRCRPSAFQSG